jgi:nitroimidazol reductase NimA-like FMN-containing flavoprotein (pyridoxamine 5'-phosphate oxidase superfamily)
MTDDEILELLREGRRAQVACHNPDGSIHLVPMSYVVLDGRLTLWTDPASRKVANLRADRRVTCLVEVGDEFSEFRAVQLAGEAVIIDDPEDSRRVGEALFARSLGELNDDMRAYVASLVPERVGVAVEAQRVVSWDHRKLAGARPDQVGR